MLVSVNQTHQIMKILMIPTACPVEQYWLLPHLGLHVPLAVGLLLLVLPHVACLLEATADLSKLGFPFLS